MRNEEIGTENGTAIIQPDDEVIADGPGIWTLLYTAGPQGIKPGGSVRFEIPYGFTMPQLLWAHDPGYCQVSCTQPGVELSLSYDPPVTLEPEPFYYVTRWGRMVYVQVLGEKLEEGEQIEFVYGWRQGMDPGAYAQHFAAEAEFTVATDVDGTRSAKFSGYTLIAEQPKLQVVADEPTNLQIYLPSYVQMGEEFTARIVAEDEERNVAEEPSEDYIIDSTDGPFLGAAIGSGQWHNTARLRFDMPGEKIVTVLDLDTAITGRSNPVVATPEPPEQRLYWGDIHGHTRLSDGLGSPEQYYTFGREQACLDFCAIADHSQYISDEDWEHIQEATRQFNEPGRYVTLLGYEVSLNAPKPRHGDKCVYYPGDTGPLLRATDINRSEYAELDEYTEEWKAAGAMMILHQHARGSETYYDPDLVRLAEVYSIWGDSETAEGARPLLPSLERDYAGVLAADCLEKGWTLGFMAASDDHAGRPGRTDWLRVRRAYPGGLAAVWAPELTREAIWDSLYNRRCYGTSGARIILEFFLDGEPMGSIIKNTPFAQAHRIEVMVCGTSRLTAVEVMRGRELIYAHTCYGATCRLDLMDEPEAGDANYYYVRVLQADGEMAWSSPIWVS